MEESIFTKIIKGDIPCHKIYEDEKILAFLDIHPTNTGHTLVIPKKQVEFVWDLGQADYEALFATVRKLAQHLREALGTNYVGVQVVGTDVPHAHVHLIPFNESHEFYNKAREDTEPDHEVLAKLADKLRLV